MATVLPHSADITCQHGNIPIQGTLRVVLLVSHRIREVLREKTRWTNEQSKWIMLLLLPPCPRSAFEALTHATDKHGETLFTFSHQGMGCSSGDLSPRQRQRQLSTRPVVRERAPVTGHTKILQLHPASWRPEPLSSPPCDVHSVSCRGANGCIHFSSSASLHPRGLSGPRPS